MLCMYVCTKLLTIAISLFPRSSHCPFLLSLSLPNHSRRCSAMVLEGRSGSSRSFLSFELAALLLLSLFLCFSLSLSDPALSEEETVANSSVASSLNASSIVKPKEGSFADIIDRALEKEFNESDQTEG